MIKCFIKAKKKTYIIKWKKKNYKPKFQNEVNVYFQNFAIQVFRFKTRLKLSNVYVSRTFQKKLLDALYTIQDIFLWNVKICKTNFLRLTK